MAGLHRVAPGERVYAVGDLHGRADLFRRMLHLIREDNDRRPPADVRLILLGDIVDRGPGSAELMRTCWRYARATDRFLVLKGNHEQVMASILNENAPGLRSWLRMGGDQTLLSWGVPADLIKTANRSRILADARRRIPSELLAWLASLPLSARSGDVAFVHAGVRPGVPLSAQTEDDLLWIGEHFREWAPSHDHLIVHGHFITEAGPERRPNRIGIDTGAFRTGRLTGLGLEGADQWVLTT